MVLFTIPITVVLSMLISVAGCGWPNSWSVSQIILACCALRKNAPNSASAADAATIFRMDRAMCMLPFRGILIEI